MHTDPASFLGWKKAGIGRNLLFLFLVGTTCFLILFMIESKIIERVWYAITQKTPKIEDGNAMHDSLEDSDVAAENSRIRNNNLTHLFKSDNVVVQ